MPDMPENAGINQFSCFLETEKVLFVTNTARFSHILYQNHSGNYQINRVNEQYPGNDLINTEWIDKPPFIIGGKKPRHTFPTKKTVKPMTFSIKQCSPRNEDYRQTQYSEND